VQPRRDARHSPVGVRIGGTVRDRRRLRRAYRQAYERALTGRRPVGETCPRVREADRLSPDRKASSTPGAVDEPASCVCRQSQQLWRHAGKQLRPTRIAALKLPRSSAIRPPVQPSENLEFRQMSLSSHFGDFSTELRPSQNLRTANRSTCHFTQPGQSPGLTPSCANPRLARSDAMTLLHVANP